MCFETLPNGEKARRYKTLYIIKRGFVYYAYDNYEWLLEDNHEEQTRRFNRLEFGQYFLASRKLNALTAEIDKIDDVIVKSE